MKFIIRLKGGVGSGNHGHKGIPGHQGGSLPEGELNASIGLPKSSDISVETDKNGHGIVKDNVYAGISDNEWDDWTVESGNVQAALDKKLKVGDRFSQGEKFTADNVKSYEDLAQRLQKAASTNAVTGMNSSNTLYRGEAYSTLQEFEDKYKVRSNLEFNNLTSAATVEDAALEYSHAIEEDHDSSFNIHAVLRLQTSSGVHRGIQTAPMGVPTNEVVLPKGAKYRVARISKQGDIYYVDLYSTEKFSGLKVVNASKPK